MTIHEAWSSAEELKYSLQFMASSLEKLVEDLHETHDKYTTANS